MKICLLGSQPDSARLAPYFDRSYARFQQGKTQAYPPAMFVEQAWDIWGCSPGAFSVAPRATRWFEVHRWEPGQNWFSPEYCQFLREFKGPVYTGGPIPEIPNHVIYPLRFVEAAFSTFFLNSSLSLMAALAILEIEAIRTARRSADPQALPAGIPVEELQQEDSEDVIALFGVDMSASEEYSRQKPGCWFFIFEALRRGIGIFVPPESDLLCPEPIYGMSEWDPAYIKATARVRDINARIEHNQKELQRLQAQLACDAGIRENMDYWVKTYLSPFRMPTGIILRQNPGSGLGGGVTHIDGKPIEETL